MSKYRKIETVFKNEGLLVKALQDVCGARGGEPVLSHANDIALVGYQGDVRQERVKFAVRRKLIGSASNDLGFEQTADGSFRAIISEFDSTSDREGYGQHVLNLVTERYNYHNVSALAWEKGYQVFEDKNAAGETVLNLVKAF